MTLTQRQLSTAESRRERLSEICRALPECEIDRVGEGHLAIRVRKKVFAYYQFDHHGDGMISLAAKSTHAAQAALIKLDPQIYFSPAYVGSKGWIGARLDLGKVDWRAIGEVCRAAYCLSAPKRLAALVEEES